MNQPLGSSPVELTASLLVSSLCSENSKDRLLQISLSAIATTVFPRFQYPSSWQEDQLSCDALLQAGKIRECEL